MSERLAVILNRLRERFHADADVAEVEAYLSSEGFDRGQIGTIVSEFLADIQGHHREETATNGVEVMRVLGPHEQGRIAPDAWGYLLTLRSAGVLSASELEDVIDRAMGHGEGRVGPDDVRAALAAAGIEPGSAGPGQGTIH